MSDLLDFIDQAAASGTRATGRNSLIQAVWIYDRGVDTAGLERFRHALAQGLLGRRVAASPLPVGRDRWIREPQAPPIIVALPRPRSEIDAWLDERVAAPIDPWHGPGWQLAVLPLTDGGSAVTLVVSHVLADGVGTATAIAEAAVGTVRELPYPSAPAPTVRAAVRDGLAVLAEVPAAVRAALAAAKLAQDRLDPGSGEHPGPETGPERWAIQHIDRSVLADLARELGGTESSVLFAVTAAIAGALGWVRPDDGAAALSLSVSRRTDGDLRGNAILDAELLIDPAAGPSEVPRLRTAVKQALTTLPETGRFDAFGPLIALLPRRTLAALIDAPPDPSHPVTTCAGVGALPAPVRAPDGSPAQRTWFRLAWAPLPVAEPRASGTGRAPSSPPPYLYVGWTGTDDETSLFAATNLATATDLPGIVAAALDTFTGAPRA
ncbi:hypothetical protein GCM10027289_09960 [Tsukamurella serpentis]